MPLKIYLSSTFADLEQHREKIYRELRSLRHDVIAMEDYVAADKRPLEQCLQDVRDADVYIGIFAWRYGYVPIKNNPGKKSITELELCEAERLGKPRLIFILKNIAPWPPSMMDATTGENKGGALINALREKLQQERLAGMFETADELAVKVVSALSQWQNDFTSAHESSTSKSVVPSTTEVPKKPLIKYFALPQCGPFCLGRDKELSVLNNAWMDTGISIVTLVAPTGVGKTALIKKWINQLNSKGWKGAEKVYIWSSFNEDSSEDKGLEDIFFEKALEWFGVSCDRSVNITEKGRLLADAVRSNTTLFVLDGLEPLQYPPGQHLGVLRAPGIQSLLDQLAFFNDNSGLLIITSRENITELNEYHRSDNNPNGSVFNIELENLDPINSAELLYRLGVTREGAAPISSNNKELMAAGREVQGHALTLSLLGRYLKKAENGDILCRDKINFAIADNAVNNGYALKVVAAYEKWFINIGSSSVSSGLELDILRLFGFFDYPVSEASLGVLCAEPVIKGLTDRIVDCKDSEWNIATTNLIDIGLLWYSEDQRLNTHQIVKEYFANQLRHPNNRNRAWEEGHKRLYLHLCKQVQYLPDDLLGLMPLYQAVAHACNAGEYEEAYEAIYLKRILRGDTCYSTKNLGAISSDLRAVSYFFKNKWDEVVSELPIKNIQGWLFNEAAFSLRALGRTDEALEPFKRAYNIFLGLKSCKDAAPVADNLSEIMLVMGRLEGKFDDEEIGAIDYAELAVKHVKNIKNLSVFHPRLIMRAYVCHRLGEFGKANGQFRGIDLALNKKI